MTAISRVSMIGGTLIFLEVLFGTWLIRHQLHGLYRTSYELGCTSVGNSKAFCKDAAKVYVEKTYW